MRSILEHAGQFQRRIFEPRREFFQALGQGQRPEACLITCADSRIDPQLLTGCEPGELFVIRNAGNLIPSYAAENNGEAASVEFAVSLGVRDMIVCGHSHCGAMEKLLAGEDAAGGAVGRWLRHAEEARLRAAGDCAGVRGQLMRIVEHNVLLQLEHLREIPAVADRLEAGELRLHGWVYRIETGEVLAWQEDERHFRPLGHDAARATVHAA